MEKQKEQIVEAIDHAKADLAGLSKNIHDNPELGFEEVKAAGFISDVLEKHGFQRCGIIHLEDGAPRIAFERV